MMEEPKCKVCTKVVTIDEITTITRKKWIRVSQLHIELCTECFLLALDRVYGFERRYDEEPHHRTHS
jgi:uncharacterized protein YlaI